MINGKDYSAVRGDDKKYAVPKLQKGDAINIIHQPKQNKYPGIKDLKRGVYDIVSVHKSYFGQGNTYDFVLRRKNSKYQYSYDTIYIDKAIEGGDILIINPQSNERQNTRGSRGSR